MNTNSFSQEQARAFGSETPQFDQPSHEVHHGRGLAAADVATRVRVASAGGTAVSQDRKHMSEIGRTGGKHSHSGKKRQGGEMPPSVS